MKQNYLIAIVGVGLMSVSMAVGADRWQYNPDTDLIDYHGEFKTMPVSEPEMVDLSSQQWTYDESTQTIAHRYEATRTIQAAAHIGRDDLYILSPKASFLDQ